jgi:hypothetical protein
VSGWMVDEGICRFYPVFRLLFRPFVSRLQMRFDARYIDKRVADTAAWVYYPALSAVSCAYIRAVQKKIVLQLELQ